MSHLFACRIRPQSSYTRGFLTCFEVCLVGLWMWGSATVNRATVRETKTERESRQREGDREREAERESRRRACLVLASLRPVSRFSFFFGAQGGGCGERQRHSDGGACKKIWPECDRGRPRRAGPKPQTLNPKPNVIGVDDDEQVRKPSRYCLLERLCLVCG